MKVSVLGSHITDFGELWEASLEGLLTEATLKAVGNAGLDLEDIQAVYVSNMAAGAFEGQMHLGAVVSNLFPHRPPALRVEGACASGGLAVLTAEQALLSETYDTVLVVGVEKMTDVSAARATEILAGAASLSEEYGSTFPGLYAMLAQAHMRELGTTREHLSAVSVKNHRHALRNPHAQYRKEITMEMASNSTLIANPLRLFDCSPLSDGAAAVVLSTKKTSQPQPYLKAFGHGMDAFALAQRRSLTSLQATRDAALQAFQKSSLRPEDIPVAEVHDCFTIAELLALEDLGFYAPGQAGPATVAGETTVDGTVAINLSGGLKASGHPVGATGVKQIAFLSELLRQGAYARALAHNVGGSGATAVVHILEMEGEENE